MIGTTVKLGFDGKQVKTGLAGLGNLFKGLGKQIAIGGTRKIGENMTDWVGKLITMIPQAAAETMDWAGALVDMSAQTRVAVKDLMILNTAFQNAGMESVDAAKMISSMQKAIYDASHGDQEKQDFLARLGFSPKSFEGVDPIKRLRMLMSAIKDIDTTLDPALRDKMTEAFFSGKVGLKSLKIVDSWAESMKEAERLLGGLANTSKETLAYWDELGDIIATRFSVFKKLGMGSLFDSIFGKDMSTGLATVNNLFDALDNIGPRLASVGQFLKPVLDMINRIVLDIKRMGFRDFFSSAFDSLGPTLEKAGESLGIGILKTIRGSMMPGGGSAAPGSSGRSSLMDSLKWLLAPATMGASLFSKNDGRLLNETKEQTEILNRIYAKNPTAIFA